MCSSIERQLVVSTSDVFSMRVHDLEIDLPSGRDGVRIAPLTLTVMSALYNASKYELPAVLIDALQPYINVPILDLLEEDFKQVLAWFDKASYPETLRNYNWRCTQPYWADAQNNIEYENPKSQDFKLFECNTLNSEQVRDFKVTTAQISELPEYMKWPTVRDMLECYTAIDEGHSPKIAEAAKWFNHEGSVSERIIHMTMTDVININHKRRSCVNIRTSFKCNCCGRKYSHFAPLNPLKFLRTYSPQSVMDMSWNLTSFLDAYIPDDAPLMKFLYWHGCYVKDKNEAEERKRLAAAANKSNRSRRQNRGLG